MQPLFIGDIHDALVVRLKTITTANGYRTDAGLMVSEGFVADSTGAYLNNEVDGDSFTVQPEELSRGHQQGSLPLTVFGLTKDPKVRRLYELEDDVYRALRDADWHPRVRKVEFSTAKLGAGESEEFFGVSVPVRIHFTHSLI